MKFGVLTGGGDSPGMNAFIRAVVRSTINLKSSTSIWGVIDGWAGLRDSNFRKMTKRETAGIGHSGGTVLGTLRVPELKDNVDMQEGIALNLHDNFFDYLLLIGGNGSLAAAAVLDKIIKEKGYRTKILVTSGSIDNDVCNKYGFSVGFYSAIDKSLEMLEWIRDTASAHRRVYIVKSMGRESGYLPFFAGISSGAEHVILPNEDVNFEQLATLISERDRDTRIIVSEGYHHFVEEIRATLEKIFEKRSIKNEIRTVDMGYFQRGGKAEVKDILLASWLGYSMVKHAFEYGDSGFFTTYNAGQQPTFIPLEKAIDSNETNNMQVSQQLLDFANALM